MIYKANNGKKKISAIAICLLLTVVMATGATLAYLSTSTNPVKNTFTPAKVGNYVDEKFETIDLGQGKTVTAKQNVTIQNAIRLEDGTITTTDIVDAYIRAKVVVTWRSQDGKFMPATKGIEYSINMATDDGPGQMPETNWVEYDGYYYYTEAVKPGEHTGVFIYTALPMVKKDGYTLHVEIVSQSIQAEGTDAVGVKPVVLAWGVDPSTLKTQP